MRSKRSLLASLASAFLLMFLSLSAHATDRYVATTGSNANPGTAALPWKTIQFAINNSLDGDTVYVAAGTYNESILWDGLNLDLLEFVDLTLVGAGEGQSIISGAGLSTVITTSDLTPASSISGFTIQNGAGRTGGGMQNLNSNLSVFHCTFKNNSVSGSSPFPPTGGGMYNEFGSPTITDCTFSGNQCLGYTYYGGGMSNVGSNAIVSRCTFIDNQASNGGGGMYNEGGSPTITDCSFTHNGNSFSGGGMWNVYCDATISNCTFSSNSGYHGGGMNNRNCSPVVTGCLFRSNSAGFGGGMYNEDSSPVVRYCAFANNNGVLGGGMSNFAANSVCAPVIGNCTFTGNVADQSGSGTGGGIYSSGSDMSVTNCLFTGNSAREGGGGILFNNSANATVTNCTITGNITIGNFSGYAISGGGGICYRGGSAKVTNCIVWGNQAPTGNAGIDILGSTLAAPVSNSDVQDLANSTPDANHNFAADPRFVDAPNSDLHLQRNSPARNLGDNSVVIAPPFPTNDLGTILDLDNLPRIADAVVDLGAYEVQNTAPVANNNVYTVNEDTTLSQFAPGVLTNDTDADADPITAVLVTGPAHGSLTLNADGSFLYTPVSNYNGPDSFTYKANDGLADSSLATVTLLVKPVNDAPVAKSRSLRTDEDSPQNVNLGAIDVDGDTLSWAIVSGPSHGTLSGTAPNLIYTPVADYNGPDSITFKANDGQADSNIATISITVIPVNDAPTAVGDAYTTDENTPLTIAAPGVLANDSDVEGDILTAVLVTSQSHGSLTLNPNGSFTYTPEANFSGTDTFTYKVTDGQAESAPVTVTLTIRAKQNPPDALDDTASTLDNTPVSITVLSNDSDPDGDTLSVQSVTQAANGTVTLNADGTVTYKPKNGFVGSDSFTYTISDGHGNTDTATVRVSVASKNHPPKAQGDNADTKPGVSVVIAVLSNDSDADGDTLSVQSVTQPDNGTVTINADGTVTYKPNASFRGNDSFTYTVSDGKGGTDTARVRVRVR